MKLYISSDHAGVELKDFIINTFSEINWQDLGPNNKDSVHYPNFANKLCEKIISDSELNIQNQCGILICGSGIGMSIAANRYSEIRATLCHYSEIAELSRKHNNSNVLVLGARFIDNKKAKDITSTWIATNFEGGRHQSRLDLIK